MSAKRMPRGFVILRYHCFNSMITDIHITVYERYYGANGLGREDPRNKIISKEEAMFVVESLNFSLVVDNIHGKVWE